MASAVGSLNARWQRDSFHRRIAELADIADGDSVLDLGCGSGATLPHLIERVSATGKVVALDSDPKGLTTIADRHAQNIAAGTLQILEADAERQLPFPDRTFDAVICQNVLECVHNRPALISEIRRVLRDDGSAVLGHHDFDGVILASSDPALTRRIVHGFADTTQSWQATSDGQMGRQLPGLTASAGFSDVRTETVLFVDLGLEADTYAQVYVNSVIGTAPKIGISQSELDGWLDELTDRSSRGAFYFAIPWVYAVARK